MAKSNVAKKEKAAPAKNTKSNKKKGGKKLSTGFLIFAILSFAVMVLFFPYAIIFWVGMSPTIVSFVVDPDRDIAAPLTLGGVNICGVVPVLLDLWRTEAHVSDAIDLLSDPFNLLMMFGAASVGWVIWTLVPRFYATIAASNAQRRLNALKKARDAIIEEWGADITMTDTNP